jgi:hypothetical protein
MKFWAVESHAVRSVAHFHLPCAVFFFFVQSAFFILGNVTKALTWLSVLNFSPHNAG